MSDLNESSSKPRKNPLIWVAVIVIGLIVFVFFNGDRGDHRGVRVADKPDSNEESGSIDRSLLVPPGMRAREFIRQIREDGEPYPLQIVHEKATQHMHDGSLADAHLLYFFAAREDHLVSIMVMGEMSDPALFQAENSLLDHADVIQAYKWYQKAAALGHKAAAERIENLQQWAQRESRAGNADARQLLLNFE